MPRAALDARSDLYSLACIAYEMLAGRPPFLSDSVVGYIFAHVQQAPDLTKLARNVPAPLVAWVGRCLEKDPADRFASADEARDALLATVPLVSSPTAPSIGAGRPSTSFALPSQASQPPTPLETGRSTSPPSRRTGRWLALGGGLMAVALLTWGIVEITSATSYVASLPEPEKVLAHVEPTPVPSEPTDRGSAIPRAELDPADRGSATPRAELGPADRGSAIHRANVAPADVLEPSRPDVTPETTAPEVSAPATQRVALTSVPTGATVKRDGQVLGKTPLELTWLVGETTPFKVELKAHDTATLRPTDLIGKAVHEVRLTRSAPKDTGEVAVAGGSAVTTGTSSEDLYKEARALDNSDPAGALKLYQQAASKGHTSSYKMIGSIQVKNGNKPAAIAAYKRYLAANPSARDADTVRQIIIGLGGTP